MAMTFWSVQSRMRASLASNQVSEFRAAMPEVLENAAVRWAFPELAEPLTEQVNGLVGLLGAGNESDSGRQSDAWKYVPSHERTRLATDLIKLKNVVEQRATISPLSHQLMLTSSSTDDSKSLTMLAHRIDPSVDSRSMDRTSLDQLAEAILSFNLGHTDEAIESLQRSLDENPAQPTAWLLLGYSHIKNGNLTLAEQAYSSSLALAPNQWRVWFCRGLVKLDVAKRSNRKEEFEEAAQYFTRALELKPTLAEARFNRAICREHLGDTQAALDDAVKIADIDRIAIPAKLFCARQHMSLGQKELADDAMNKAFELKPQTVNDFIELGLSRMDLDPKQAIQDLLKANELRPATVLVLQNLAYLTMEVVPDPKLAETILNEWVTAVPRSAVAVASRAVHRARQSRLALALDDASLAIKLTPTARETAQIASVYALVARSTLDPQEAKQCRDQAFAHLANALQQDWKLVAEISQDPDLLTLRDDRGDDTRLTRILGTAASLMQLPKLAQDTKAASESKSGGK